MKLLSILLAVALSALPLAVRAAQPANGSGTEVGSASMAPCDSSSRHDPHKVHSNCFVTVCMAMIPATPYNIRAIGLSARALTRVNVRAYHGFKAGLDPPPPRPV